MATKSQIIEFIMETFIENDGNPISKAKLDSFKKAELEEFIEKRNLEDKLKQWLNDRCESESN